MSIDYRTLLKDAFTAALDWHGHGNGTDWDAILATRIPDLCPDCKGSSRIWHDPGVFSGPIELHVCTHPNAPTIADLLHWGENVARADQLGYGEVGVVGFGTTDSAAVLLAALRTEADR